MLSLFFVITCLLLPSDVHPSCCRLPFTDTECHVNRQGPHRYYIMPDRKSGIVRESTECTINDFNSTYRKVIQTKNYCNDCPGLLILHTNSSEIFLFPEYLERILEGRTPVQRKNVVILTTSLVGAYDLDFTYFARYYASRPYDEVPSFYVDLQLPPWNPSIKEQPSLRLRLPSYIDDKEGISKINRQELMNQLADDGSYPTGTHQLPFLYHFDMGTHHNPPAKCNLYEVQVSPSSLIWHRLDPNEGTCHEFASYFGRNPCLATGFKRLFCPIVENIEKDDSLRLSPYLLHNDQVEHLTIAVTGGPRVYMSFSNDQIYPAEQVKILLLQGHLVVTDTNAALHIRVEYGWNCDEFSLTVPAGYSATRYRRFDGETLVVQDGEKRIDLPRCFRLVANNAEKQTPPIAHVHQMINGTINEETTTVISESEEEPMNYDDADEPEVLNTTTGGLKTAPNFWESLWKDNNWIYAIIAICILIMLLPICLGLICCLYCSPNRKSHWTLDHDADQKPVYHSSKNERPDVTVISYADNTTQTKDKPIRI